MFLGPVFQFRIHFYHSFDPGCVLLPGFSVCLELWGQLFSGETAVGKTPG